MGFFVYMRGSRGRLKRCLSIAVIWWAACLALLLPKHHIYPSSTTTVMSHSCGKRCEGWHRLKGGMHHHPFNKDQDNRMEEDEDSHCYDPYHHDGKLIRHSGGGRGGGELRDLNPKESQQLLLSESIKEFLSSNDQLDKLIDNITGSTDIHELRKRYAVAKEDFLKVKDKMKEDSWLARSFMKDEAERDLEEYENAIHELYEMGNGFKKGNTYVVDDESTLPIYSMVDEKKKKKNTRRENFGPAHATSGEGLNGAAISEQQPVDFFTKSQQRSNFTKDDLKKLGLMDEFQLMDKFNEIYKEAYEDITFKDPNSPYPHLISDDDIDNDDGDPQDHLPRRAASWMERFDFRGHASSLRHSALIPWNDLSQEGGGGGEGYDILSGIIPRIIERITHPSTGRLRQDNKTLSWLERKIDYLEAESTKELFQIFGIKAWEDLHDQLDEEHIQLMNFTIEQSRQVVAEFNKRRNFSMKQGILDGLESLHNDPYPFEVMLLNNGVETGIWIPCSIAGHHQRTWTFDIHIQGRPSDEVFMHVGMCYVRPKRNLKTFVGDYPQGYGPSTYSEMFIGSKKWWDIYQQVAVKRNSYPKLLGDGEQVAVRQQDKEGQQQQQEEGLPGVSRGGKVDFMRDDLDPSYVFDGAQRGVDINRISTSSSSLRGTGSGDGGGGSGGGSGVIFDVPEFVEDITEKQPGKEKKNNERLNEYCDQAVKLIDAIEQMRPPCDNVIPSETMRAALERRKEEEDMLNYGLVDGQGGREGARGDSDVEDIAAAAAAAAAGDKDGEGSYNDQHQQGGEYEYYLRKRLGSLLRGRSRQPHPGWESIDLGGGVIGRRYKAVEAGFLRPGERELDDDDCVALNQTLTEKVHQVQRAMKSLTKPFPILKETLVQDIQNMHIPTKIEMDDLKGNISAAFHESRKLQKLKGDTRKMQNALHKLLKPKSKDSDLILPGMNHRELKSIEKEDFSKGIQEMSELLENHLEDDEEGEGGRMKQIAEAVQRTKEVIRYLRVVNYNMEMYGQTHFNLSRGSSIYDFPRESFNWTSDGKRPLYPPLSKEEKERFHNQTKEFGIIPLKSIPIHADFYDILPKFVQKFYYPENSNLEGMKQGVNEFYRDLGNHKHDDEVLQHHHHHYDYSPSEGGFNTGDLSFGNVTTSGSTGSNPSSTRLLGSTAGGDASAAGITFPATTTTTTTTTTTGGGGGGGTMNGGTISNSKASSSSSSSFFGNNNNNVQAVYSPMANQQQQQQSQHTEKEISTSSGNAAFYPINIGKGYQYLGEAKNIHEDGSCFDDNHDCDGKLSDNQRWVIEVSSPLPGKQFTKDDIKWRRVPKSSINTPVAMREIIGHQSAPTANKGFSSSLFGQQHQFSSSLFPSSSSSSFPSSVLPGGQVKPVIGAFGGVTTAGSSTNSGGYPYGGSLFGSYGYGKIGGGVGTAPATSTTTFGGNTFPSSSSSSSSSSAAAAGLFANSATSTYGGGGGGGAPSTGLFGSSAQNSLSHNNSSIFGGWK